MNTKNKYPLVSVIIPHYNGMDILSECLDSISKSTYSNIEIIVVDNNSADDSVQQLKEKYPSIKLLESAENLGFAGGCNLGVSHSSGKYCVILNNDTIHQPNWIEPLVEMMESDDNISSVQPKILNYYNHDKFDYAGGSGGFMDYLVFPFARGRIFDTVETDNGQYDDAREIFWASGTAFITRTEIFQNIGGFDEDLFAHFEEIDYHWKCHLMGYNVWVQPKSVIYHKCGATLSDTSSFKTYLNHRNSILLLLTNYSGWRGFWLSIPRMALEGISFLKELFTGRFSHAFAHVRAKSWLVFHPQIILKRRKLVNSLRKLTDEELKKKLYQKSVVLDYFLRKRKSLCQNFHKYSD
ncbi:MAG: glycosyltransferase family 2 protein [Candidatus Marinimicrobia bacterium]|nr:glycosyltransferase family 2 protein [Candidatus Neomarinimicrobiota bacterium]MBL7022605.1 glycosyltransferase family 2 protein [Candidatus Neomarinimicrobiota bacterium]